MISGIQQKKTQHKADKDLEMLVAKLEKETGGEEE